MKIKDYLAEYNPSAILFLGLDDAIVGIGQQHGGNTVAVYDRDLCINIFYREFTKDKEEDLGRHLSDEEEREIETEAVEWFEYNVEGAYLGENTPIFMLSLDEINMT
jgi:hypothetical protein